MDAVILDHNIDTSFISQLEHRNQNYKFMRIDADVTEALKEDVSEDEIKALEENAQKMTDKYIAAVDEAVEVKTKEILTV